LMPLRGWKGGRGEKVASIKGSCLSALVIRLEQSTSPWEEVQGVFWTSDESSTRVEVSQMPQRHKRKGRRGRARYLALMARP